MQRQKTIAKWLAVILLLTLAVACYVILSAILDGRRAADNIAGAQDSAQGDNIDPSLPSDDPDSHEPPADEHVYSEFPRAPKVVGGMSVGFIGGENDEKLLDCLYWKDMLLLAFSSDSEEHDVRQSGIHIAIISDGALTDVVPIAQGEELIDLTLSADGLMLVTADENNTTFRLLDESMQTLFEQKLPRYSAYKIYKGADGQKMYVADDNEIGVYSIKSGLSVKKSGYTLKLSGAIVKSVFPFDKKELIIAENDNGVYICTFASNEGFILQKELLNCRFKQILPTKTDGKNTAALLLGDSEGYTAMMLSPEDMSYAEYSVGGVMSALLYTSGTNVMLLADDELYTFCSHLEFTLKAAAPFSDGEFSGARYEAIDGSPVLFLAVKDGVTSLFKIGESGYSLLLSLRGADGLTLLPAKNGVAYFGAPPVSDDELGFGGSDVFYLIDTAKEV